MTDTLDHAASVLADAVVDDADAGVYRANRRIFTDEEIFELEMKHIFEGNWIYLAHESQMPNPGDYFTTYIGRQPVVITRDKRRRAALPDQRLRPPRRDDLPTQDRQPHDADLPVPRLDVPQRRHPAQGQGSRGRRLSGHLQRRRLARPDQGRALRQLPRLPVRQPQRRRPPAGRAPRRRHQGDRHAGRPVTRWCSRCCAGRRPTPTTATGRCRRRTVPTATTSSAMHWNYAATTSRRGTGESANVTKALDAGGWGKSGGGYWSFPHGHLCLWTWAANPQDRPLWDSSTSSRRCSATPRASSWSRAPATCACTRTSI